MPDENGASEQRTQESRRLDRFHGLRESGASLPEFIAWNDSFPAAAAEASKQQPAG